jgi:hypothetical protein
MSKNAIHENKLCGGIFMKFKRFVRVFFLAASLLFVVVGVAAPAANAPLGQVLREVGELPPTGVTMEQRA